jgi:hypothetical protein
LDSNVMDDEAMTVVSYYLVLLQPGPTAADADWKEHEAFIDLMVERNVVLLGGEFGSPVGGAVGAYLLHTTTRSEAESWARRVRGAWLFACAFGVSLGLGAVGGGCYRGDECNSHSRAPFRAAAAANTGSQQLRGWLAGDRSAWRHAGDQARHRRRPL